MKLHHRIASIKRSCTHRPVLHPQAEAVSRTAAAGTAPGAEDADGKPSARTRAVKAAAPQPQMRVTRSRAATAPQQEQALPLVEPKAKKRGRPRKKAASPSAPEQPEPSPTDLPAPADVAPSTSKPQEQEPESAPQATSSSSPTQPDPDPPQVSWQLAPAPLVLQAEQASSRLSQQAVQQPGSAPQTAEEPMCSPRSPPAEASLQHVQAVLVRDSGVSELKAPVASPLASASTPADEGLPQAGSHSTPFGPSDSPPGFETGMHSSAPAATPGAQHSQQGQATPHDDVQPGAGQQFSTDATPLSHQGTTAPQHPLPAPQAAHQPTRHSVQRSAVADSSSAGPATMEHSTLLPPLPVAAPVQPSSQAPTQPSQQDSAWTAPPLSHPPASSAGPEAAAQSSAGPGAATESSAGPASSQGTLFSPDVSIVSISGASSQPSAADSRLEDSSQPAALAAASQAQPGGGLSQAAGQADAQAGRGGLAQLGNNLVSGVRSFMQTGAQKGTAATAAAAKPKVSCICVSSC